MKKLLIMAAMLASAVVANAAAVSWSSSSMTLPSGSAAGTAVTGYLFIVDATTYGTYAAYADATKLSDAVYSAYKGSLDSGYDAKGATKKSIAKLSDGVEYSSGDTVYAVLLYTTTQDAKDYWMGNYGTVTLESSQDQTVSQLGNFLGGDTNGTATAWSTAAVPEPTSGLLLLLGMAGLALKRKRA